ncbi:MAG: Holliday junction branch migration protein RuvA [Bacteroidaceae bacterium]|nr:Holliday junction branch migration protein RuvA [Bacteroidaceae bacterium]
MIEYLKGTLAELQPAVAVVECGGVGYCVNISLNTYSGLQQQGEGNVVKVFVEESIREDAHLLYGFTTKAERTLFALLTSVSGVGAATARMILSALSPSELVDVVSTGNERLLKSVKGIGLKTAQRIIVDLKDKIVAVSAEIPAAAGAKTQTVNVSPIAEEAVAALTALGFSPAPSNKVVLAIIGEEPDATVERVIKLALKRL